MPKNKTHSGAKKRFRLTGTGKVMKQGSGLRHNLENKPTRVTRRFGADRVIAPENAKVIKKLLGH